MFFLARIGHVFCIENASNYAQITPQITPPLSKLENPPVCVDAVFLKTWHVKQRMVNFLCVFRAENASELAIELYGRRDLRLKNASNF